MRQTHRQIEKDGSGSVALIPDDAEDMWHAYNLISAGDSLKATTLRKVKSESSTGSVDSKQVRTTLKIQVLGVEFDTEVCMLRVKGRNIEENPFVKMGAHHTIDMELNRKFTLYKDEWDSIAIERLDSAIDPTKSADLAAVIMQEGLATVCLVTNSMTLIRSKIEKSIPRKRRGDTSNRDKGMNKFYDSVMDAVRRHINFDVVKCVLVASPGFVREQFLEYMFTKAIKMDYREIMDNRSKFVPVHTSSGHMDVLKELLADPSVTSRLASTKASSEVAALNRFYKVMNENPDRALYGFNYVMKAHEMQAIEVLLVTDALFRSSDISERKKYVKLVDDVRDNGGDVKIFSSLHVSGEQLGLLSGVAAILRFPLPDIECSDDDSSEDEDD